MTLIPEPNDPTPVRVQKLGHVVFMVTDIERTTKFWTEIMGFHVSDRNAIEQILDRTQPGGFGLRSLIHEVVQNTMFQKK